MTEQQPSHNAGLSHGPEIDYYFTAISSYAYIGHWAFMDLVKRLNLQVTYRPIQLAKIFDANGGLAVAKRHPARLRNRLLELQRWRDFRGLEMNVQPKHFPTNPALADAAMIAVIEAGKDPAELMGTIMRKVWVQEQDIADRDVLAECLTACGEDAQAILAEAEQPHIQTIYDANTEKGAALDIIGSPTIVYQGEPFWGQDRFDMVEAAIQSGRPAYSGTLSS